MKLEIARSLFLLAALAVTTVAVAAWEQPRPTVLSAEHGTAHCPLPRTPRVQVSVQPDRDFLLFMVGLAQGVKS